MNLPHYVNHNDMGLTTSAALARRIVAELRAHGFAAWLVGGCVRDELLGIEPKDYDIATSARPDEVLRHYPRAELVGAHFGVVLVHEDGAQVEVATFRSDHDYQDGRRPERVTFETDPRHDALRRDFTINALFLDPASGELLDFSGGRDDLKAGLVRAIGDAEARFAEDHLRMLRAVRIAARFRFQVEPRTMAAMRAHAGKIREVSMERNRDELLRILTEGQARRGFELLDEAGLLKEILPAIKALQGVEQPAQYHPEGDVWTHVMMMLEAMGKATPTLALGVLFHDVGKPPTFRIAERIRFDGHVEAGERMARGILAKFRCSTEQIERVAALVANHMKFKDSQRMKQSTLKRFLRLPHFDEHLELHRLDCLSSNRNLENYQFMKRLYEETPAEALRPARLATGADLIRMGMQPGPEFSRILGMLEDAQLEGRVQSREQALALVAALHEEQRQAGQ